MQILVLKISTILKCTAIQFQETVQQLTKDCTTAFWITCCAAFRDRMAIQTKSCIFKQMSYYLYMYPLSVAELVLCSKFNCSILHRSRHDTWLPKITADKSSQTTNKPKQSYPNNILITKEEDVKAIGYSEVLIFYNFHKLRSVPYPCQISFIKVNTYKDIAPHVLK